MRISDRASKGILDEFDEAAIWRDPIVSAGDPRTFGQVVLQPPRCSRYAVNKELVYLPDEKVSKRSLISFIRSEYPFRKSLIVEALTVARFGSSHIMPPIRSLAKACEFVRPIE